MVTIKVLGRGIGMASQSIDQPEYTLHIKEVSKRLNLSAMDLVRLCGIGVSTAYRAVRNDPTISSDTAIRIYNRLKEAGYAVTQDEIITIR